MKRHKMMTDLERILVEIVSELYSTQLRTSRFNRSVYRWESGFEKDPKDAIVHFETNRAPEPGDLVLATTGPTSRCKVSWYVSKRPDIGGAMVREIGTDKICEYSNESFVPIVGFHPSQIIDGVKRELYIKILKAFRKGIDGKYRYQLLEFENPNIAVVTIREAWAQLGSHPFKVKFEFDAKTTIKSILKALIDGGCNTRDFSQPQDTIEVIKTAKAAKAAKTPEMAVDNQPSADVPLTV